MGQTGSFRFLGRGSNGKYQLDVDELRQQFNQGPEIAERLRQFRINRILAIESGAIPVELEGPSLVVMHFVPIDNFASGSSVDARPIALKQDLIATLLEHGGRTRTNVDGWIARSGFNSGRTRSYVQLYRNGTLESVTYWERWEVDGMVFLPGTAFDEDVHRVLQSLQQLYGAIGVAGPVAAMVSLIGMKGWRMGAGPRHRLSERHFDRAPLLCPEVVLDSIDGDVLPLAKPLLDLAWNAAGFSQSMNYDQTGKWNPIRS